jgi:membrane-bound ClpP family serine protease
MITLGVVLLVIGFLVPGLHVLWTIGVLLLVVGVVLWILGSMGRAVGGRKHYY